MDFPRVLVYSRRSHAAALPGEGAQSMISVHIYMFAVKLIIVPGAAAVFLFRRSDVFFDNQ
jgi:hypothetical protein